MSAQKRYKLQAFQDKLASLTFFDPACGSGNFLTETFLSLRRLENKVIQAMYGGENVLTFDILIKVNISQFYGIEINDFACTVAKTALWIAECQTLKETSAIAGRAIDFLPLKTNAYIHEGNALRMDWGEVIAPDRLNYIMGNPPFVGYAYQSKEQKEDLAAIMKGFGNNIDYVAGWYLKSAQLMQANPRTRAALVSILDARAKYPDCTLADMYGDKMYLFPELLTAHQDNDRAVMAAYGFTTKMSESECVTELFKMYQQLTK